MIAKTKRLCQPFKIILTFKVVELRKSTLGTYIKDNWNKLDLSIIIMNFIYFANKLKSQPNPEDKKSIPMILLDFSVFVLSFLKGIYFLRIFEDFGHLIQMLTNCMRDISVFLVFLITWILVFAMMLDTLEVNFDDGDYPNFNSIFVTLIQM